MFTENTFILKCDILITLKNALYQALFYVHILDTFYLTYYFYRGNIGYEM